MKRIGFIVLVTIISGCTGEPHPVKYSSLQPKLHEKESRAFEKAKSQRQTQKDLIVPMITFSSTSGPTWTTAYSIQATQNFEQKKRQEKFAGINFSNLIQNMAEGRGDFLASYIEMFQCQSNDVRNDLRWLMKTRFASVVPRKRNGMALTDNVRWEAGRYYYFSNDCSLISYVDPD